ncbi:MAG: MmcQ/YjbR family DNA-binding protein [Alphaproteobacteria bacterium]|nr:MmcQ/YjbR family DNA-binding protein [Alphaproteobacteria bacterium]
MSAAEIIFKNLLPDAAKLEKFGFTQTDEGFVYARPLSGGQFSVSVLIKDGEVRADVIDIDTQEVYVLVKIPEATGAFVGALRAEFEDVLHEIAQACFTMNVFKSVQAKQIISYIEKTYHDKPEFLWQKFPENAIFRRSDNQKWYAALLTAAANKIGLAGNQKVEILDLRCSPDLIPTIVDGKAFFPGYHMNKKHWITLCLNGIVPTQEIYQKIDESYQLAKKQGHSAQ